MHSKTYPAFFTPRDKEPSLSSSEEKSLEFGWLEIKITRKQKYIGKTKQVLCKIYSLLLQKVVFLFFSLENRLSRAIYMKITIIIIIWLFTLFPNLITKESYNWWVTRRKWGFRHKKSEAKYPKVSIANIGKLQEKFRCTVQNGCEIIS